MLYLLLCLQLDQLMQAREQLNVSLAGTAKLSVNDFIVKAAALACKKVPAVNASWMGEFIRQFHHVDVNVAVNSPAGLMVPFVRDADRKGLLTISEEVKSLAGKVRDGDVFRTNTVFSAHKLGISAAVSLCQSFCYEITLWRALCSAVLRCEN